MKILKFKPHFTGLIAAGKKNVTWRLFDTKDLKVGDDLELVNSDTNEKFANAVITDIREKKLGEIEEDDYEGHGRYASKDAMVETFRNYYGDIVNEDTMVKIVEFKLV